MYFFKVTESLFNRVFESMKAAITAISPIVGSLTVVFLAIITIGLLRSNNKKKYIKNNFVMIVTVLCVEGIVSILFFDRVFIKINLLMLVICLLVLVIKTKTKKRTIKKLIIEEEK